MEVFKGRYYKSSSWFLHALGLWPYQKKLRRVGGYTWFVVVNLSLAIPQLILLIKKWGEDFNVTFENSASLMYTFAMVSKYIVVHDSGAKLKILLLQISHDWKKIVDEDEKKILEKYSEQARNLVIIYTFYSFSAWLLYTSMPLIPIMLDYAFPLENGTRSLLMPFYADYLLFDIDDNFYFACGHISFVYFFSFFLCSGVDGTYVLIVKHTCGLFAITCDRLNKTGKSEEKEKPNWDGEIKLFDDSVIQRHLSKTVLLHNESISCYYLLEDVFSGCFIVIQSMCVILLALCGVYAMFIYNQRLLLLRISAFFFGMIIHLLYLNWVGQQIIDISEQVFHSTYCSDWYLISAKARKFTNMIMSRSIIPCQLTAGKITSLSVESFGILIKTSASYYTVFLSMT